MGQRHHLMYRNYNGGPKVHDLREELTLGSWGDVSVQSVKYGIETVEMVQQGVLCLGLCSCFSHSLDYLPHVQIAALKLLELSPCCTSDEVLKFISAPFILRDVTQRLHIVIRGAFQSGVLVHLRRAFSMGDRLSLQRAIRGPQEMNSPDSGEPLTSPFPFLGKQVDGFWAFEWDVLKRGPDINAPPPHPLPYW